MPENATQVADGVDRESVQQLSLEFQNLGIALHFGANRRDKNGWTTLYNYRDRRPCTLQFFKSGVNAVQRLCGRLHRQLNRPLELGQEAPAIPAGSNSTNQMANVGEGYSQILEGENRGQRLQLLRKIVPVPGARVHTSWPQ